MTPLAIGTSLSLPVDPRPFFVPSGLNVAPGERYRFTASGKWQDWFRITTATGWKLWPLQRWNRVPGAAFFCLCGCVGQNDRDAFVIGAGLDWTVPDSIAGFDDKQLNFFANDWPGSYGNNLALPPEKGGPLTVTVTRLA
ncbi:MAG: hypothetical protein K9K30_00585 [Burkholderiaceae bacterium]|nr:hypothetical protein [Sulfuritalea sp.]MCF8173724.1 hypothetical protein [Burkholderiaceae bacterium]